VPSAPSSVGSSPPPSSEHQAPTTTSQTQSNQLVSRRSNRPIRRPARYDD